MPAITFFEMLKQSRILYLTEKIDLCDINYLPAMNSKGFDYIKGEFINRLKSLLGNEEFNPQQEEIPAATHEEAKTPLFAMLRDAKKVMGYGR